MAWRPVQIKFIGIVENTTIQQLGDKVEISTKPVTVDRLVCYKQYVYRDEYGYHICVKDANDPIEGLYSFIGRNTNHFQWCDLKQIFELRDTVNPVEYNYKHINVQDLRYKNGRSPKKIEEVNALLKKGWHMLTNGAEIILERKKRLKRNAV